MLLSDLDIQEYNRRWQIEEKETAILIADQPAVGRVSVGAPSPPQNSTHKIEVRIGTIVLWHELTESDVQIGEGNLRDFVANDLELFPEAMDAYLWIAYRDTSKRETPELPESEYRNLTPDWIWCETESVEQHSTYISIFGKCYKASR